MPPLPTGTVTFLFTDLEGSTRLWEAYPDAMAGAVADHDALLRDAIAASDGVLFSEMGDGVAAAFPSAADAIAAALEAQLRLASTEWPDVGRLRARMGLHAGEGRVRDDGHYVNLPLNQCSRLMASAHGGQVVVSDTVEALSRGALPAETSLLDLGEHRLRDVARPLRIYELVHPSLQQHFPPLVTLDGAQGNLPPEQTSFVGRAEDVARVKDELHQHRLVTLTGVGGVGKTRLALRVAGETQVGYRDGTWLVELAGVRDPTAVPEVVAETLRIQPRQGQPLLATLVEFLRAKDALVVLDNCEHLVGAVSALVGDLERSCLGVRILATSRQRLNAEGERTFAVSSLEVPDDTTDRRLLDDCEALRLFADRARAVKHDFVITPANAGAVADICRRLDGLPLAIELAAARAGILTPTDLVSRLHDRFRLLTEGTGPVEHHQTLRATLDWSYDLLDRAEQDLLDRLSVFAGGFDLDAADAVAGGGTVPAVLESISGLVGRSLVVADTEPTQARYSLLETVRQYSQEHLDQSGDAERVRASHARYYRGFAETAAAALRGPDELAWLGRLARELDNLRAALQWAIDSADVDTALRVLAICSQPNTVDSIVGYTLPALAERALDLEGARDHSAFPDAQIAAAWYASNRGDQDLAARHCDEAVEAQERLATEPNPSIWGIRGAIAIARGRVDQWIDCAERQVTVAREAQDSVQLVWGLTASAMGRALLGDVDAARPAAEEALRVARDLANPRSSAWARMNAGFVLGDADPPRALALLREAAELSAPLGHSQEATAWGMAADVAARHGDQRDALELSSKALQAWHWDGYRPGLGLALRYVGDLIAAENPETAARLFGAADAMGSAAVLGGHLGEFHRQAVANLTSAVDAMERDDLRTRGAAMAVDEAVTCANAAITQALSRSRGGSG